MAAAVRYVLGLLASLQFLCSYTSVAQLFEDDSGEEDPFMGAPKGLEASANVTRLLDSLMMGYDKRLRPDYKGPPVEVTLSMYVSSISSISEVDMDFTVDMYFRQIWKDRRLAFSDKLDELCISNEMLSTIWWPDTFFANAKASKFHQTTTKNAFLRIKPSAEIVQSLRLTVTAMCNMNLMYFPMDSQLCSLEIESYGYSMKDIAYKWMEGSAAVDISDEAKKLPTFTVQGLRMTARVVSLTTGNYSRMAVQFLFGRNVGYYIIYIYIPSALIVVLSWLSFWLSCDSDRVSLGITIVLTMTALIYSTNAALPKVSYLKSIDIYLFTCFVFGATSLFEAAVVSYLSTKQSRRVNTYSSDADATKHGVTESLTSAEGFATARHMTDIAEGSGIWNMCCLRPALIDQWSRVVFPLLFFVFQLVYWVVYICISRNDADSTFRSFD